MKKILKYWFLPAIAISFGLMSCNDAEFQKVNDAVYIESALGMNKVQTMIIEGTHELYFTVRTAKPSDKDVKVTIAVDEKFLEEYNERNSTSYHLLPEEFYTIENTDLVIQKGAAGATTKIELTELSAELNKTGFTYVLPVGIDKVEGGPEILASGKGYIYAITPIPYADVPEFRTGVIGSLLLAEDMEASTMTMECLICYASTNVSQGQKGHPFVMFNNAEGANPTASNNGIFSRFGDGSVNGNIINGNIRGRYDLPASAALSPNKWHHLAYVFDLSAKKYTWFLDGKEALPKEFTADYGFVVNKDRIYLGRETPEWNAATGVPLRYSQVRLWNTTRTADQLKNNMYGIDPSTPGLVGYWKMDEGEGNVLKDATGKNPDGAIVGPNGSLPTPTWVLNQRIETGR